MENKYFDLTSKDGLKKAETFIEEYGGLLINPINWIIIKTFSPEKINKKQVDAAIEIIKEGKKQNVKKMKIKVSHQAGIDIASTLKEFPAHIKFGNEACTEIEVEYK